MFDKIVESILPNSQRIGSEAAKKILEEEITTSKKWILLVLDELDKMEGKCQDALVTLFEWPYIENSKLLLIGIANTSDLEGRILQRIPVRIFGQNKFIAKIKVKQQLNKSILDSCCNSFWKLLLLKYPTPIIIRLNGLNHADKAINWLLFRNYFVRFALL
jgi:Cdc6-like AAA superfamily ATPase